MFHDHIYVSNCKGHSEICITPISLQLPPGFWMRRRKRLAVSVPFKLVGRTATIKMTKFWRKRKRERPKTMVSPRYTGCINDGNSRIIERFYIISQNGEDIKPPIQCENFPLDALFRCYI